MCVHCLLYTSVEHTLHILKAFYLPYERRGEPQAWCVLDKQRGKVIGHVCFHALEDDTAQLAYVLHPCLLYTSIEK